MPRRVHEEDLRVIEVAVRQHPDGLTAQQIDDALQSAPPRRTLQYRLKSLVTSKRLVMEGTGRWARYRAPRAISLTADFVAPPATTSATLDVLPPLSEAAMAIREHLRRPTVSRTPVGYDREFLDSYRPNETFYLSESDRALLQNIGRPKTPQHQPAGTYAKRLLDRLLLDPFEQTFFVMVQLPYLQPFDDVNKRVSRLGIHLPGRHEPEMSLEAAVSEARRGLV